ncbi:hypothetical protein [Nonomuraea sp. NPDC003804]|uniref:hypothetical protein n=1 Tax=Nonomuraea sp. NPDC003804 TaxID=3154547 RepID=UPI0033B24050
MSNLEPEDEPDFADEHSPSPSDPANQPEQDPDQEVYGGDEGYERPTDLPPPG